MSFAFEMLAFLRERRKFWLVPLIVLMSLFATFIAVTSGSVIAPFIYTLF